MRVFGEFALLATAAVVSTSAASAADRVTHAAVGALAGAVVAGPVGFVGGGVIGYVAGRRISCDLGVERCYRRVRYRRSGYSAADAPRRAERSDHSRGPGDLGTHEDHGNY